VPNDSGQSEVGRRTYARMRAALGRIRRWGWPPWRYFVGNAGVAAVLVWVERAAHISSGGVNGLSLALAPLLGWNLGLVNFLLKILLFLVVLAGGGGWTATWTVVSAALIGLFAALFSRLSLPWHWPSWLAVAILLSIAYLPTGLVLSCGYSTGGYSAVAQLLEHRRRLPLWITLLALNLLSVLAMYLVYGRMSGIYSLIATLGQGPAIHFWTNWARRRMATPARKPRVLRLGSSG
jgi:uncharacterized membrane-anchored protein YitT (DUF2179 family)